MRVLVVLPTLLALAAPAAAQRLATTLDALCRGGGPVVQVRVLDRHEDAWSTRVRIAVVDRLRGEAADTLLLQEPSGRACGRALHGLVAGAGYVAFLADGPAGYRLAGASSRALVALEPGLVEHLRALLSASDAERVELLAAALDRDTGRIRDDAALALQVAPGVEGASVGARRSILVALAHALPAADGRETSLCTAAARTGDPAVAELLVPIFLNGRRPDLDRVVLDALARLDGRVVAHRIPRVMNRSSALRVVALARRLPQPEALQVLAAMLASDERSVRVATVTALFDRGLLAPEVVRLGAREDDVQRAQTGSVEAPRFRSIDPRRFR